MTSRDHSNSHDPLIREAMLHKLEMLAAIAYYLVCYPFRAPECIKLNAAIFRFTLVLSDLNVFT